MPSIVKDINLLRQMSEKVTSIEEAKDLISQLESELGNIDHGVGLAAIQLGYPKRVGVIKHKGGFFHLINPVLVSAEDEMVYFNEGCLSFPGIFRDVKRYRQITVQHQRIDNNKFVDETFVSYYSADENEAGSDGLTTIAIQHELDHFDGKLLIDHEKIKVEPFKRESVRVGRNEPCPCGSGKKYKKCCGR